MKRILALSMILLLGLSGSVWAYSINYSFAVDGTGNGYTSPYAGASVESFDSVYWNGSAWVGFDLFMGMTGSGDFVTGSVANNYAAPYGISGPDSTQYVTVPQPLDPGFSTGMSFFAFLPATYNYLGLWWGSVDTYNEIRFYSQGSLTPHTIITGPAAINPSTANGNQTAPSTNLYVNILDLPDFDSFEMRSTNYAFEADNIAVMYVPEPATMLLLALGLIGITGIRRKM